MKTLYEGKAESIFVVGDIHGDLVVRKNIKTC